MDPRKVFTCQNCDAEMEVADPRAQQRVACRRCGRSYGLRHSDAEQAWVLTEMEPVEPGADEARAEEPFRVLGEVGRPKRVDRSEVHREQTDIHEDEDIAVQKPRQKP